jgi:hypothetical protein
MKEKEKKCNGADTGEAQRASAEMPTLVDTVARFRPIVCAGTIRLVLGRAVTRIGRMAADRRRRRRRVLNVAGRHPIRAAAARAVRHADNRIAEDRIVGGGPPIRTRVEIGRDKERGVRGSVGRGRRGG